MLVNCCNNGNRERIIYCHLKQFLTVGFKFLIVLIFFLLPCGYVDFLKTFFTNIKIVKNLAMSNGMTAAITRNHRVHLRNEVIIYRKHDMFRILLFMNCLKSLATIFFSILISVIVFFPKNSVYLYKAKFTKIYMTEPFGQHRGFSAYITFFHSVSLQSKFIVGCHITGNVYCAKIKDYL